MQRRAVNYFTLFFILSTDKFHLTDILWCNCVNAYTIHHHVCTRECVHEWLVTDRPVSLQTGVVVRWDGRCCCQSHGRRVWLLKHSWTTVILRRRHNTWTACQVRRLRTNQPRTTYTAANHRADTLYISQSHAHVSLIFINHNARTARQVRRLKMDQMWTAW